MINISDKSKCCGCTACASICPYDAICMQPDELGFLYPMVDRTKCVDCGLCEKVCSFNDHYDTSLNFEKPKSYAARHKEMSEVETSRSGATFIALSDWVLEQGGVVYGAGYTDHFRVVHKRATTKESRNEFKGSKYVQSDLTRIFRMVKDDLRKDRIVLFSGTPCQVSALHSFVGLKLRQNLYLIDIVCHGVPSPYVWRDFVAYLEKKQQNEIRWVNFRDKQEYGWAAHRETFVFSNSNKKKTFNLQYYQEVMFRRSCYHCHFCNTKRSGDITIGDYWGWDKNVPEMNRDDKGLSLILVNTRKGEALLESAKEKMNIVSTCLESSLQPNLIHPTALPPQRDNFEKDYTLYGFEYVAKRYGIISERCMFKMLKSKITSQMIRLVNLFVKNKQ